MILSNYFSWTAVIYVMKLSFKNIAITLGIAAGAAVAAVITTKSINKPSSQAETKKEGLTESLNDLNKQQEEDILYV